MKYFFYIIELDLHRPRLYRLLRASFVIFLLLSLSDLDERIDDVGSVAEDVCVDLYNSTIEDAISRIEHLESNSNF